MEFTASGHRASLMFAKRPDVSNTTLSEFNLRLKRNVSSTLQSGGVGAAGGGGGADAPH
jgi:hypothetical protein